MYSGLREVGEEVKAINENLLTYRCVRVYAYARIARACARSCVIGEGDGKVGRNEKESGGGSEEGWVIVGRKDCRWKYEGGVEDEERENPNRKSLHAVHKGECWENKG